MANLNNLIFSGRLFADPELKYNDKGTPICNFRVGNNIYLGSEHLNSLFCTAFGKLAEVIYDKFKKGSYIAVDSSKLKIVNTKNDDGTYKTFVNIIINSVDTNSGNGNSKQPESKPAAKPKENSFTLDNVFGDDSDSNPFIS